MVGARNKASVSFCRVEWKLLRTSTVQVYDFTSEPNTSDFATSFCSFFLARNSIGSNTQLELATRFIALATVGNEAKAKYIYALNVAPVDKMRLMDLIQKTTDETPCPFDSLNLMKDSSTKSDVNIDLHYHNDQLELIGNPFSGQFCAVLLRHEFIQR